MAKYKGMKLTFTKWDTTWSPPATTVWEKVPGDGNCYWHSLRALLPAVAETHQNVSGLKDHILQAPPEVLSDWVRCFGGNEQGLEEALLGLRQVDVWADWIAIGMSTRQLRVPIAVWSPAEKKTTVFWNAEEPRPQRMYVIKLSSDHFEPSLQTYAFKEVMANAGAFPRLGGFTPNFRGGAKPDHCAEEMEMSSVRGSSPRMITSSRVMGLLSLPRSRFYASTSLR